MLNPIEFNVFPGLTMELFGCRHSDADSNPAITVIDGPVEVGNLHKLRHGYHEEVEMGANGIN